MSNVKSTIRDVNLGDRDKFNQLSSHPLQAWEWGEFRKKTGIEVVRLGRYDKNNLIETAQITIHPIPFTKYTIGYFPKGSIPSKELMDEIYEMGKRYKCIFIKLEPNATKENSKFDPPAGGRNSKLKIHLSPHPLFTKYTFQLDLVKTEDELLKNMHSKTRYNIRVAQKHGVEVGEDNSEKAFEQYLTLMKETTKRQKYFAHTQKYHRLMWETLATKNGERRTKNPELRTGNLESRIDNLENRLTVHLLKADYNGETLVSWIVFLFNNVLYYPYGASSSEHRNVMASNLMMWEAIRWGKNHGAKLFDMWGSLGPNPNPNDPWYGFHRFKEGYGAKLVEFIGSYDLVINNNLYTLYNTVHKLREIFLHL